MSLPTTSAEERVLLQAMANSPICMALVGLDGQWLSVNESLCTFLGYPEDELLLMSFQDVTHPEDLDRDLDLLYETLAGLRSSYRIRKRYLHRSGEILSGDLSVTLLRDDSGEPLRFISQIVDVTEWLRSTVELQEAAIAVERERRVMEAILNSVDVAVAFIEPNGQIELANRHYEELSALARGLEVGDAQTGSGLGRVAPISPIDDQPRYLFAEDGSTPIEREDSPLHSLQTKGEFDDLRLWVGKDSQSRRAVSVSGSVVPGPTGDQIGLVLSYKDVTELAMALKVKDEFVASVSHELRTPLTSVLGHLEILGEDDSLDPGTAKAVQVIQRNASRLYMLVGDLLQVLRAADGGIKVRRREVDVVEVLRDAVEAAQQHADQAQVSLGFASAAESLVTLTDAQRLRQVADNLISNAIKYSEPGDSAEVSVELSGAFLEISVADTGIGIDEADQTQLFSRFFRCEDAITRHIQGTGLGLNIVRSIVTALGGEVSLKSQKGVGSTFRVQIPFVEP